MNIKPHFIIDESSESKKLKKTFLKKFKIYSLKKSNVIIVFGGDGFMLHTLKKLRKNSKPFYGINTGNKPKTKELLKYISKAKPITISPLEMMVKTKNNKSKKSIAINEISMFRQSKQTASLKILKGKKTIIKKLISDGVLVSTPAGSTAYNLSVHGPILSLNSNKLAITPISPFRPRRWKGCVVSNKSIINIKNLNINKRPVSVVADNLEVRNVKEVKIYINCVILRGGSEAYFSNKILVNLFKKSLQKNKIYFVI